MDISWQLVFYCLSRFDPNGAAYGCRSIRLSRRYENLIVYMSKQLTCINSWFLVLSVKISGLLVVTKGDFSLLQTSVWYLGLVKITFPLHPGFPVNSKNSRVSLTACGISEPGVVIWAALSLCSHLCWQKICKCSLGRQHSFSLRFRAVPKYVNLW